jgi:hydrogenase maturation protease
MRVVVAAFGNELRGDDGFGIAVLRRLEASPPTRHSADVTYLEVGTAGLRLAQELLTPCDRLIVIDAMSRGGQPGTVYVLQVDEVAHARDVDMHLAVPSRALSVAQALGTLPRETFLVGCEPSSLDELTMELSDCVQAVVDVAANHVHVLIGKRDDERPSP